MEKKQVFIMLGVVIVITAAIVGYCLFYGNQYTIRFDTAGGNEIEQQVVRVGDKVEKPEDPVREGYNFVEWQYEGEKYDFDAKVKRNMILVATWQKVADATEIFYKVTFDSKGGSKVEEQNIAVGETVIKPTDPVKDGYTFQGWFYNEKKYDFDKAVSTDITLVAKWKEKTTKPEEKPTESNKDDKKPSETNKDDNSSNLNSEIKVGDRVRIVGAYASSSTAGEDEAIHTKAIGWKRVVLKIYEGREYPYRVGDETGTTGFFKAESLEKIG